MSTIAGQLIEDIYDTVTFPERWNAVLRDVCAAAGATSAFLFTTSDTVDGQALWARHNISDGLLADYTTHYRHRDLWANAAAARGYLNRCVVRRGEDLVSDSDLRRSAIFNDLLAGHGMGRLCALALADKAELALMQPVLGLYRPADTAPFSDASVRLLQHCAPHLQRAMRLRVRLWARQTGEAVWSARMIERLPMGVFLLDGRKTIVGTNRIGKGMLDRRDGLRLLHGTLQAERSAEARALARALHAAVSGIGPVSGLGGGDQGSDLRVSRPSGLAPYLLTVLPLSHEAAGFIDGPAIRAVVYAVDPALEPQGLEARLGRLFGLTRAECRLVADLLRDLTPAQSGETNGVAISTVRSQLRSVFSKTGTTRQSELVNLVGRCLLLPGPPGP